MELSAVAPTPPSARVPVIGGRPVEWNLRDILFGCLWFLTLFLMLPLPFAAALLVAYGEDSTGFFIGSLLVGAASEAGLIVVAAWFTFRKYGGGWERLGFKAPGWGVLGWATAAIVATFVFNIMYTVVIETLDIGALKSACDDQVPKELQDSTVAMVVASVVFVTFAPVCEEIFFRGFVFPGFWRAFGVVLGAVASGFVFSVAHISPNLHKTIIPIFVIGVIFALAYWKSGNILTTMLAHFAQNAMAVALLWTTDCT